MSFQVKTEHSFQAKNLFMFCSIPMTSCEAEFKVSRLIDLVKEISRQPNDQSVTSVLLAVFKTDLW